MTLRKVARPMTAQPDQTQLPESLNAQPVSTELMTSFAEVTKCPTPTMLRRGVFGHHIGFDDAVARKASGKPFYIFLSITPIDQLFHLRHVATFKMAKALQVSFDCPVVIHMLDTKACLRDQNPKTNMQVANKMTTETVKDIMAFGFDVNKTVIAKSSECMSLNYVMLCDLQRRKTLGEFEEKFLKDESVSIAEVDAVFQNACFAYPPYLSKLISNFEESRCLMLLRPSQAHLYQFAASLCDEGKPPMALFGGFVPSLQGTNMKMPKIAPTGLAAKSVTTLYLKETAAQLKKKMNSNAFSGGKETLAEHCELGADLSVDVSYFYMRIFEDDDAVFAETGRLYGPGDLPEGNDKRKRTGDVKKHIIDTMTPMITELQSARKGVTPQLIKEVTQLRAIA